MAVAPPIAAAAVGAAAVTALSAESPATGAPAPTPVCVTPLPPASSITVQSVRDQASPVLDGWCICTGACLLCIVCSTCMQFRHPVTSLAYCDGRRCIASRHRSSNCPNASKGGGGVGGYGGRGGGYGGGGGGGYGGGGF